jgi:hypothetical protein
MALGGSAFAEAPPTREELAAKANPPVSSDELARLMPGNTLYHTNPSTGNRIPIYYAPNGTRHARIRGTVYSDPYRIEDGKLVEYSLVLKRNVRRLVHWLDKPKGVLCEDDVPQCGFWFEWVEGNPEKLGH